jgi:hypothetical protein
LPCETPLRRLEEVLERYVEEGTARLREDLLLQAQVRVDMDAAPALSDHAGGERELRVDRDGPAVADEDPRRHRGEAVPGREQAGSLVERRRDEAAVDDARPALVALVEAEARFVAIRALLRRLRKVDAVEVVAAAPAGGVVVRRDPHSPQTFSNVPSRSSCS